MDYVIGQAFDSLDQFDTSQGLLMQFFTSSYWLSIS